MINRVLAFRCVAAALLLFAVVAGAGEDADTLDPLAAGLSPRERLDVLVERVKVEQSRVETMRASFEKDTASSLLLEPETARGEFLYRAPDRVLWRVREPLPVVMALTDEEMVTYFPDRKTAERVGISSVSERVFEYLGASGSLETLMQYFSVTAEFPDEPGEEYHLKLLPRYARIKKRIASMDIWVDAERFLPSRLRYTEPNGDHTEYRFRDVEVNLELPDERFELELPPDVKIETVDLKRRG
ncbi:MAG TPA: outer membrane lipoprotein carrier protein LolA [Thermoanaerobaculia bacterium]|nr:outer membrane lipoprotein carrier protein LolA [Thermoanaerobaculia bacterium]